MSIRHNDICRPGSDRGGQKRFADYSAVFASVQQVARTKVGGEGVLLSQFPYAGTHWDASSAFGAVGHSVSGGGVCAGHGSALNVTHG